MPNPRPGNRRYKGPVHEAVRGALSSLGINTNPTSAAPAKPFSDMLSENRAAYLRDVTRAYGPRRLATGAAVGLLARKATKAKPSKPRRRKR